MWNMINKPNLRSLFSPFSNYGSGKGPNFQNHRFKFRFFFLMNLKNTSDSLPKFWKLWNRITPCEILSLKQIYGYYVHNVQTMAEEMDVIFTIIVVFFFTMNLKNTSDSLPIFWKLWMRITRCEILILRQIYYYYFHNCQSMAQEKDIIFKSIILNFCFFRWFWKISPTPCKILKRV